MTDREVPGPPDPFDLDPLIELLPSGAKLWHVHRSSRRPAEFNPGLDRGRFHPLLGAAGKRVPTLYTADSWEGALCETVFRDLPTRGLDRNKRRSELESRAITQLQLEREVPLVALLGNGLLQLGMYRGHLLESDASQYSRTTRWGEVLYREVPHAGGLLWVPRFHDTSRAMVFFGDRVGEKDFSVLEGPIPLGDGEGLERVMKFAAAARILLTT